MFVASTQVHNWRFAITNAYIKKHYCEGTATKETVLGGITVLKMDEVERTGAFQNDTHCMFSICAEEFYYYGETITVNDS